MIPETPQSPPHEPSIAQPAPTPPNSPEKDQPSPTNTPSFNQDLNQPSKPSEIDQPSQAATEPNVLTFEAAVAEAGQREKPKSRVKHAPKVSTFSRKKKRHFVSIVEDEAQPVEAGEEVPQPEPAKHKRDKLEIKKKTQAAKGVPTTVTSGAFTFANVASTVVADADEEIPNVTTSDALEVEKAKSKPEASQQPKPVDSAKSQALEEAKQRLAERVEKVVQDIPSVPATSAERSTSAVGSDETIVAGAEGGERKKKKKKAGEASKPPVKQSGRIRSGVSNK